MRVGSTPASPQARGRLRYGCTQDASLPCATGSGARSPCCAARRACRRAVVLQWGGDGSGGGCGIGGGGHRPLARRGGGEACMGGGGQRRCLTRSVWRVASVFEPHPVRLRDVISLLHPSPGPDCPLTHMRYLEMMSTRAFRPAHGQTVRRLRAAQCGCPEAAVCNRLEEPRPEKTLTLFGYELGWNGKRSYT